MASVSPRIVLIGRVRDRSVDLSAPAVPEPGHPDRLCQSRPRQVAPDAIRSELATPTDWVAAFGAGHGPQPSVANWIRAARRGPAPAVLRIHQANAGSRPDGTPIEGACERVPRT